MIAGACRDHERLRFAYKARDGTETRRHVEPLSLVNLGRRWYLVAWDCDREDWRTFRLDRIPKLPTAGGRFEPRTLPGGVDPATYVSENLSGVQYRHQARVTLHAPAARDGGRPPVGARTGASAIDDRSCSVHAQRRLAGVAGAADRVPGRGLRGRTTRPSWPSSARRWRGGSEPPRRLRHSPDHVLAAIGHAG